MLQTSDIANWGIVAKLSRITKFYNIVIRFVWALKLTLPKGPGGQSYKLWGKSHYCRQLALLARKSAFPGEPKSNHLVHNF
jgi:hypothetical protein